MSDDIRRASGPILIQMRAWLNAADLIYIDYSESPPDQNVHSSNCEPCILFKSQSRLDRYVEQLHITSGSELQGADTHSRTDRQSETREDSGDGSHSFPRPPKRRRKRGGAQDTTDDSLDISAVTVTTTNQIRAHHKAYFNRVAKELGSAFNIDNGSDNTESANESFMRIYGNWFNFLGNQPGMAGLAPDRASQLVRNAASIGGPEAMWQFYGVLQQWQSGRVATGRTLSDAFQSSQELVYGGQEIASQNLDTILSSMWELWNQSEDMDTAAYIHRLGVRVQASRLWRLAEQAEKLMKEDDATLATATMFNGRAKMRTDTAARDLIFRRLVESRVEGASPQTLSTNSWQEQLHSPTLRHMREKFNTQLRIGCKWAEYIERFGLCAILMVPDDIVRDSWVNKLSMDGWQAFLNLIGEKNGLIHIFKSKDNLLVDLLRGGTAPMIRLRDEDAEITLEKMEQMSKAERIEWFDKVA